MEADECVTGYKDIFDIRGSDSRECVLPHDISGIKELAGQATTRNRDL